MSALLLRFSLLSILILTVTSLATRALGSAQPPNPALYGFIEGCEDQPQPCWYGIVPAKTLYADALQILTRYGFTVTAVSEGIGGRPAAIQSAFFPCQISMTQSLQEPTLVETFSFYDCHEIQLGDVLFQFGEPHAVGTTLSCASKPPQYILPMSFYWLTYTDVGSLGLNARPDFWAWLSPNDPVVYLDFNGTFTHTAPPGKWEGFIPFWRYYHLHVEQVQSSGCGP